MEEKHKLIITVLYLGDVLSIGHNSKLIIDPGCGEMLLECSFLLTVKTTFEPLHFKLDSPAKASRWSGCLLKRMARLQADRDCHRRHFQDNERAIKCYASLRESPPQGRVSLGRWVGKVRQTGC